MVQRYESFLLHSEGSKFNDLLNFSGTLYLLLLHTISVTTSRTGRLSKVNSSGGLWEAGGN